MNLAQRLDIKAKYKKTYLVDCLQSNLAAHKEEFERAWSVYLKDVSTALLNLQDYVAEAITNHDGKLDDLATSYAKLRGITKPSDASKMYEQYILLIDNSFDDVLELDISDANSIINDSWDWAISAKAVNSTYSNRF